MAFTYTDSDKIVLEAWGKFKVKLLEAVEPGDLLSFYNTDATYAVQFADESDSQRADCFAVEGGAAGDTITAALAVVCSTIPTIGDRGDPTAVYFAASTDYLGAPLYLGESGKPESDVGTTYKQQIGRLIARDQIYMSVMPTSNLETSTFLGTITPTSSDGAALGTGSLMWSDLFLASGGVINFNNGNFTITHSAGALTLSGVVIILGALYLGAGVNVTGAGIFNSGISVAGTTTVQALVAGGGASVAGTCNLQTVIVGSSLAIAAGGTLTLPQTVSATQLPAADPSVAGELYVDSGTVKRSSG